MYSTLTTPFRYMIKATPLHCIHYFQLLIKSPPSLHYINHTVYAPSQQIQAGLTRLVDGESTNVRVDLGDVVRRDVQIEIRDGQVDGTVDSWVAGIGAHVGLDGVGRISAYVQEGSVGDVQLADPQGELGSSGHGGGDVAVVGTDRLAGVVPGEEDLAAGVGERVGAVVGDGRRAVDANLGGVAAELLRRDAGRVERVHYVAQGLVPDGGAVDADGVGLVVDVEGGEVLPDQTGLVGRAGGDVGGDVGPGPGLRDADLEPLGHGEEALELAEDDLLAGFDCDGLEKHLGDVAGVEVLEEAVDAGLSEAGDLDLLVYAVVVMGETEIGLTFWQKSIYSATVLTG